MRRARTGLACAAALALSAGPAYAQEDGVFVDPDSPSGKEYAIPLESARRQADPRPVSPPAENASSPSSPATLFGEGVVTARSARAGDRGGSRKAAGGSAKDRESDGRNPVRENPPPQIVSIAASRPGAPDGGVGTPALIGGAGLLVLLLGAVAGFLVRRRAD